MVASTITLDASDHPIESVTVFKTDRAEVVRTFKVSLEEGQTKIQIRNLPHSIDTESARVTGLGDAQLFDVVCSVGSSIEIDTASTAEAIRKLKVRVDVLVDDVNAINDISQTMMTYSKSIAGDSSVPPRQAERFFENLLSRSRAMTSTRADLEEEILQLTRQIDVLSLQKRREKKKMDGEVSVVIMTKQATDVELRLTYLVRSAVWSATYELHATTEAGIPAPPVSLHYRARITQSTGEDWTDIKLRLSTADLGLSTKIIPVLPPTTIRPTIRRLGGFFDDGMIINRIRLLGPLAEVGQSDDSPTGFETESQRASPAPSTQSQNSGFGASALGGLFGTPTQTSQPVPLPPPVSGSTREQGRDITQSSATSLDFGIREDSIADEEQTDFTSEPTSVNEVHESPVAVTYHVEGASGVPSSGTPHRVTIAVLNFEAKIQHVVVPKVRPLAYLQATVKNTSDYRLLPGTVHAFVDDSFVSKTGIVEDVAPGDEFSCTVGADPVTRIRYARTSKRLDDTAGRERSASSEQWATTTYHSRTTVTNRHPFALRELMVRDGVPVCKDVKSVSVVLHRPAGLAELEQGKELQVGMKEGGGEGEGESEGVHKKQKVRWCKAVDGKGGWKQGLFEWVVDVGAGEELTIETEWDVKAPVSLRWEETQNFS